MFNFRLKKIEHLLLGVLFYVLAFSVHQASAQYSRVVKVVGDEFLQGRVSNTAIENHFGRLPLDLKSQVREPVWNLGQNAAGLYVDFKTTADSIQVKYKVRGGFAMPHMPSTGVSGLDLYVYDVKSKKWNWAFGKYSFKDTVTYNFENIGTNEARLYRLYLPLYNIVDWMDIRISNNDKFEFVHDAKKPIVVYGTSIAQGACATRPGLAWTNILGRSFVNHEIVNLGFSGNGRLEQPILDIIVKENAAVYILDCIPNLALTSTRNAAHLDSLVANAVSFIRKNHPTTPIILTAHSSANTAGFLNIHTMEEFAASTKVAKQTFDRLVKSGVKNLHWISEQEIGLDVNATVDYAHPNDYGMLKIANAYERLLKKLL